MKVVYDKNRRPTWVSEDEEEIQVAQEAKARRNSDPNNAALAKQAEEQRAALSREIGSSGYKDRATRVALQKRLYDYQNALSNLRSRGYDTSDAESHFGQLQNYHTNQTKTYSQFVDENAYNAALRQYGYQQKYSGQDYFRLGSALDELEEGSEEHSWLTDYRNSDAVKNSKVYDQLIEEAQTQIDWYEKHNERVMRPYDPIRDAHGQTYGGKYDDRLAQLRQELEELQANKWRLDNEEKYGSLSQNENYEVLSRRTDAQDGLWFGRDRTYDYINDLRGTPAPKSSAYHAGADQTSFKKYDFMTQEEKDNYNYLYQAEGQQSAEEYLNYLTYALDERRTEQLRQESAAGADRDPILSSVASVPANLVSGVGLLDVAGQYAVKSIRQAVTGEYAGPVNYNTTAMDNANRSTAIRGQVAQNLADEFGVIQLDEQEHPMLSRVLNGKSWGDVYQLGMSMADSAAVAALSPFIGSAGTLLLGGSAGTQGVLSAVEAGATDEQALWMGILNGSFEMLFEKVSLDNLLKGDTKHIVRALLTQGFVEGTEELNTSLANNIADVLIMAEKSGWERNIQTYMTENPGMSREEAAKLAFQDAAIQLGWDFVGGMATGGIMGGGHTAISQMGRNAEARERYGGDLQAISERLLTLDPENALAKKVQEKLKQGSSVGGGQIYKLVQAHDTAAIEQAVTRRLTELGETGDVSAVSAAVTRQAMGESLSRAEEKTIAASAYGQRVANELNAENIRSGSTSSGWTGRIGTRSINAEEYNALLSAAQMEQEGRETEGMTLPSAPVSGAVRAAEAAQTVPDTAESGQEADGSAWLGDEQVVIDRVASVEDGEMTLTLTDGRTVNARDITHGSEGAAQIYAAVAALNVPVPAANALLDNYFASPEGVSAMDYALGMETAYQYGQAGLSLQELERHWDSGKTDAALRLTPEQRKTAYELGRAQRQREVRERQARAGQRRGGRREGAVTVEAKNLSEAQRAQIAFIDKSLAKHMGNHWHFYESYERDGKRYLLENGEEKTAPNGWYDPKSGDIYIDVNAGNRGQGLILNVAAHEITHHIRETAPEAYEALVQFMIRKYAEAGKSVSDMVDAQLAKAKRSENDRMTREEALEEFVADSMETMFTDSNAVQRFVELREENKSLFDRIVEALYELSQKIHRFYAAIQGGPETAEGRFVAEMKEGMDELEELLAQAMAEAAGSGRENTISPTVAGRIRLSTREETAFWSYEEMIRNAVDAAITNKGNLGTAYNQSRISRVPKRTAEMVRAASNGTIDISKKYIAVCGSDILHEYRRHSDPDIERDRGQIALTKDSMVDAIKCIYEPDVIECIFGNAKNPTQRQSFAYAKQTENGHYIVCEVVGGKSNPNIVPVEILHIRKSKWDQWIGSGKTIGEMLFQSDRKKMEALDVEANKKSRVIAAQFASDEAIASTPHSPRLDDSVTRSEEEVNQKLSTRDPLRTEVSRTLQRENEKLKEDLTYFRQLLRLQGKVTNGTKFRRSSVQAMAKNLMKSFGARGDSLELTKLLEPLYEFMAQDPELTVEELSRQARPAVDWLREHLSRKTETDEYSREVLDAIRSARITLSDQQKGEAASRFGSYGDYRRSLMGSVVIANDGMALDEQWQEWAALYPGSFAADANANDMPGLLADLVASLRRPRQEDLFGYEGELLDQELLHGVYDGYWKVDNLYTVADRKQKEINALKAKHREQMGALRAMHTEKTDQLRREHREEIRKIRQEDRERSERRLRQVREQYQQSRRQGAEGRRKTELRHKIRRVVDELNRLLLREDKKNHVPDKLKKAVADALALVNMDTVGAEERIARYEALLANETDQVKIDAYQTAIDNIRRQGEKVGQRLMELRAAYTALQTEADPEISGGYDEAIAGNLEELASTIGNTSIRNMTEEQLQDVYDMFKAVLHKIREANRMLAAERTETVSRLGSRVIEETRQAGGEHAELPAATDGLRKALWNNQKPIYAMEKIGSRTLTECFMELIRGEGTYGRDVAEATAFAAEKRKAYRYDKWDFRKKHTFTSDGGRQFSLTLEQMLSLYAYSRRRQAHEHLQVGGFVFDDSIETYRETKAGDGPVKGLLNRAVKYRVNTADAHRITPELLAEITGRLTEEQVKFAEEMQAYLSDVMGAKGNEVTTKMYGIRLFKEKHYFPLKSSRLYTFQQNEENGSVRIKNSGFTNRLTPGANNPIILTNFMDAWAGHVHDMAMYHAFLLPLEDFNRVYHYKTPRGQEGQEEQSVQGAIHSAYGQHAVNYVNELIRDLNGGARSDPRESTAKGLMSRFKKAAVFASLSVVIQQPSALMRAQALVDGKYFLPGGKEGSMKKLWAELKRYAPIVIIKEMGHFDMDTGRGTVDYIKGDKTFLDKLDDIYSAAPAKADEWAWTQIWSAVKKETAAKHPELAKGSEEFLQAAGERFTEVIVKTQVYDSTLARSANMRSKSAFMSMATAFMAEPTTSVNMLEDGVRSWKRGWKRRAVRQFGAVYSSVIANALLVSLVYAMRDDDEDETFLEKYAGSVAAELVDGLNPMTYYPLLKDAWSIAQGYDVERSDMSLINDVFDALNRYNDLVSRDTSTMTEEKRAEHEAKLREAAWDAADGVASFLGRPLKNLRRDALAVLNTARTLSNGKSTTSATFWEEVQSSALSVIPILNQRAEKPAEDKLYEAMTSGDEAWYDRLAGAYADEQALHSAIRSGLRANDGRIRQAAEEKLEGNTSRCQSLIRTITAEGIFDEQDIIKAIDSESAALFRAEYGFDWDNRKTGYADDLISRQELLNLLVSYGGKTREEAKMQMTIYDWQIEGYDIDDSNTSVITDYETYCEPVGIEKEVYYDAYLFYKDSGVTGEKYSKTKECMPYINGLPLTAEQKTALALCWWGETTVEDYKLW